MRKEPLASLPWVSVPASPFSAVRPQTSEGPCDPQFLFLSSGSGIVPSWCLTTSVNPSKAPSNARQHFCYSFIWDLGLGLQGRVREPSDFAENLVWFWRKEVPIFIQFAEWP